MNTAMKWSLTLALVLAAATSAWAQAVGNWQNIHGTVQSVQGDRLVLKADDGRVFDVDVKQVSPSVRAAMEPNLGVTVTGFPGSARERFTARYIVQDNAGPAPAAAPAPSPGTLGARIATIVPQFVESKEFKDRAAGFRNDHRAAGVLVTQLYRGFFEREPRDDERRFWTDQLLRSHDVAGTVDAFVNSPEYAGKNKRDRDAIVDLYRALFARTPSDDEVRIWEPQIAQR